MPCGVLYTRCRNVTLLLYWTVDAGPYCKANPRDVIAMKDNCAHYIDCEQVVQGASDAVSECTYPDLFSTLSMTCQAFTTVHCDNRPEPQAPCELKSYECRRGF